MCNNNLSHFIFKTKNWIISLKFLSISCLLGLLSYVPAVAQKAVVSQAVDFKISRPVRDLPASPLSPNLIDEEKNDKNEMNRKQIRKIDPNAKPTPDGALYSNPDLFWRNNVTLQLPNPATVSFDGLTAAEACNCLPPDTNGEVGLNHYVQTVNVRFRIWDKAGNPLTAPTLFSSLFAPLGTACAARNDGDPIVMYDQLADRWIISQFCTPFNPVNHQMIAVSQTGDPTGAYYLYEFAMPNNKFNDYPHFGVWPDAYYMTNNQFNQALTAFVGGGNYAFDRKKMLAGDPTASYIYFDGQPIDPNFGGVLPSDLDGYTPPPAGTPNTFAYFTANEYGDPIDGIRLFDFHADFAVPANSTFTERAGSPLAVAAFNPYTPPTRAVIPQLGTTSKLDPIGDRLMFRLSYRNMGSYETLITNHTVDVDATSAYRAGVRFYQLKRTAPANPFTVVEQQSLDAGTTNRWMGSGAINHQGDIAVGYSVSDATMYPAIRYSAKLGTDPPGSGLVQGEQLLHAGTGAQTSTSSRWGDYSDMTVDPTDDCTFWYTQEYYSVIGPAPWKTRILKFSPGTCTPSQRGNIAGTVTNCITGLPIANASVQVSGGFYRATNASGQYSSIVVPGTYTVTVSAAGGYGTEVISGVVVANNGTATVNVCLAPSPTITATGATLVAESCIPANTVVDPDETVTVSFCLQNIGGLNTTNLVGTLLATGGVTSPGGPQNYGVVLGGGAPVCRNFSFTANTTCGGTVTATLQLQDGARDLGTITYSFVTGTTSAIATTYSSGNIAVPIPDNNITGVDIPINVPDNFNVSDVNVSFRLNHTFNSDLIISLIHPDNTVISLVSARGGSGDNFGTGANDCSGTPTVLDDAAATAISGGTSPFAGTFRPEAPLSTLNGKPANGTWKLRIVDNLGQDVGTVGCFQLQLKGFECCVQQQTPSSLCTYTQGYYGNKKGTSCDGTNSYINSVELMKAELLNGGTITIGRTGFSVILLANSAATATATAEKINSVMPGGGTPTALSAGNCTITDPTNPSCFKIYLTKQGKINNSLLSQTITLSLNMRMPASGLGSFQLQKGWLVTQKRTGCGEGSTIVACSTDVNAISSFRMETSVIDYLTNFGNNNATVNELLNLANDVLGKTLVPGTAGANGNIVPSFISIASQVEAINNAFDKCRASLGYFDCEVTCANIAWPDPCVTPLGPTKAETLISSKPSDVSALTAVAYPNPYTDRLSLKITSPVSGMAQIQFFNVAGVKVYEMQQVVKANVEQLVSYRGPVNAGTLLFKVSVDKYSTTGNAVKPGNVKE